MEKYSSYRSENFINKREPINMIKLYYYNNHFRAILCQIL